MPWFYVDDGFSDSKPVENLPDHLVKVPLRVAACGLWVLAGSWSAKEELDGVVPASKLRQLGGTPTVIKALIDAGPLNAPLCDPDRGPDPDPISDQDRAQIVAQFCPKSDPIRFRNWPKWQKTHAELVAKRAAEAAKKRGQRMRGRNAVSSGNQKVSPGDTAPNSAETQPEAANPVPEGLPRDPHARARRPDPTRPESDYSTTEESSPNVDPTRDHDRGLTQPVNVSASRLVATLVPDRIPAAVRTALRIQASQLVNRDGLDTDTVAEALRRWLNKPGAGVGLLDHLAADIVREHTRPGGATTNGLTPGEAKVVGWAALGNPSTDRKELEP